MKKNSTITIIIVLAIIIILGIWIYSASGTSGEINKQNSYNNLNNPSGNTALSTNQNNNQINQNNPTGQLFSDSPFASNSYLISTSTYDAKTKKALTGFNVTKKTLSDGSIQFTLNATNPEYQTQTYIVKPGEKLYFIENNLSDDTENEDKFLADDQAILVDANGYIVVQ
jgi:hypothetical protein